MAWTAKYSAKPERRDGMNRVQITFVSDVPGVEPIVANHFGDNLDKAGVEMFVAHKLRSLDAQDTAWETLKSAKADDLIERVEIVIDPNLPGEKTK